MHWFSSDAFLGSLAETHFAGRQARAARFEVAGRIYRALAVDGRAVADVPFLDFLAPVEAEAAEPAAPLRFLPHVAVEALPAETRSPLGPDEAPAPFVELQRFPDWAAFEAHFVKRRSSLPRDSRQKRRNLEKDLGPVEFRWEDPRPETFDQCIAWKSAQYDRTGVVDHFRRPESVALFRTLLARGALVVSSLSAGGTLLAVHFGARDGRRLYSWIASYEPSRSRYSPGRLLLEDMLRQAIAEGWTEWDFGIGDMDYKWHYATDWRRIAPVGSVPVAVALRNAARAGLKRALERYPSLLEGARRLRKRIEERA